MEVSFIGGENRSTIDKHRPVAGNWQIYHIVYRVHLAWAVFEPLSIIPSSFKIVYLMLHVYSINYWISINAKITSTEQDGGINVMSMGRNGSSLAWMTNMSMGRNGSSLAWITTTCIYLYTRYIIGFRQSRKFPPPNKMAEFLSMGRNGSSLAWSSRLFSLLGLRIDGKW